MTRKRQYGSGCLLKQRKGWAIPWRETEIAPDGTLRKALRYEQLGEVTRKEAADEALAQRLVVAATGVPRRSRVTFRTIATEWESHVVPMYKPSTQKNHRHVLVKHLLPRFGAKEIAQVTRQEIQAHVAYLKRNEYSPRYIDHIHDVLSAVLRTAVKWGHLQENPATQVDMPPLTDVHLKWALTTAQVTALLEVLPALPRTLVGLAVLTGLRRGELFALRWSDVDERLQCLSIQQAVYEGVFSTPKTAAGRRQVPLSDAAFQLLTDWGTRATRTEPEALVFSTQSGKPIEPKNVGQQWIGPACDKLGLKRVTWLTFRRTYSSWAHAKRVPGKVIAQVMGHTKVDTTLNIYTQVIDGSVRREVRLRGLRRYGETAFACRKLAAPGRTPSQPA